MKAQGMDLTGLPLNLVTCYLLSIQLPYPYLWAVIFAFLMSVVMLLIARSSPEKGGGVRLGTAAMLVLTGMCLIPTTTLFLSPHGFGVRLFSELFQYFFVAIVFMTGVYAFGRPDGFSRFAYRAAWITIPLSIYGIGRVVLGWELDWSSFVAPTENNYASIYILLFGVALPASQMFSGKRGRILYTVSIMLGVAAINYHSSRAAMVAALACLAMGVAIGRTRLVTAIRILMLLAAGLAGAVYLFRGEDLYNPDSVASLVNFDSNFSNVQRLQYLRAAGYSLVNFPFGQGIGTASAYFTHNVFIEMESPTPHNTAALLATEMGVLGLVSYVLLALYLLGRALATLLRRYRQPVGHRRLFIILPLILLMVSIYDAVFFNGGLTAIYFLAAATVFATPCESVRPLSQA
ncbi:O-antigen ligase domain-containing protein [Oleiharenicola lentus]|uniref:O-antigen ligase domain-containing protein n=1 Tax=Oleiharenicola lentus TaxID=2508720 RepID=A0A4V1M6K5_9BACT|nr:O-antigen ligase family protein [Oleiharenicola lentus]RXK55719.1 O-antigen ligase domain-containing protein [Oleiharenicola lentus]